MKHDDQSEQSCDIIDVPDKKKSVSNPGQNKVEPQSAEEDKDKEKNGPEMPQAVE